MTVADYLDYYADDDATAVGLAYIEGIADGRSLLDRLAGAARRKPLVLVKGGATESGARAAASHTGALAADDKVFDGECRAAGITRAATVEEAFEAAATFATQPAPAGPNVVVLTTAGGWGVVTSDAIARDGDLRLLALPDDLRAAIDELLPPRWSRNNPVDCAGGETRDTIPEVMRLIAEHPDVHADRLPRHRHPVEPGPDDARRPLLPRSRPRAHRRLPPAPGRPLRRGRRRADPGRPASRSSSPPSWPSPIPTNPGPAAVRAGGRLCYPSGNRAVTALGHLYRDARYRAPAGTRPERSVPMARRAGSPAPLVVLGAIALVPALVLFVLWRWAAGRAEGADPPPPTSTTLVAPAPPAAPLGTPLLSFRRLPGLLARDANLGAFRSAVDGFAGGLNDTSCVSVELDGVPVGERNADLALIPASNQKLLTGAVALEVLGSDYTYTTELKGPAPAGGVVEGDVYLVGGGDPLLTSSTYPVQNDRYPVTDPTSLDALVDGLVAAGVTQIDGAVRGDGSRYDDEFFAPSWSTDVHVHRGRSVRRAARQRRPPDRRRVQGRPTRPRARPGSWSSSSRRGASPSPAARGSAPRPPTPACWPRSSRRR